MHGGWCVYVFFSPAFSLKVNLPFLFGFYLNIFPFDTVPRTFFFRALMMWLLFWALHFLLLLLLLLLFMCFLTQSHTFCAWNCTQRNRMIRNRKQIMVIYSNVFFVFGCMWIISKWIPYHKCNVTISCFFVVVILFCFYFKTKNRPTF